MKPEEAYAYCPKCGERYQNPFLSTDFALQCTNCRFVFYLNPAPSNALIIENDKGEILLVKRKFDPMKGYWDFPGGFIKPNEDFVASTTREVKEELGIELREITLLYAFADDYLYQGINVPVLCLYGCAKTDISSFNAGDDVGGYQFFSKSDVLGAEMAFPSHVKALETYIKSKK
ncbi:MAG: NUDIX domain-containing protein [Candidatus Levybacteria bacterium]|nr:NUDIX domain-containing protein [Candidatus Levybacteria bacterium]